jgi:hypothetical protein
MMTMSKKTNLIIRLTLVCSLIGSVSITSPVAAQETGDAVTKVLFYENSSGSWYSGEPLISRALETTLSNSSTSIRLLLNPLTIGFCNVGFGDLVVQDFNSTLDGKVPLRCGDQASGYVHIRARHEIDWQNQMGGPGLWDDYMVWATKAALEAPSLVTNQANLKRCYTTPIQVYRVVNGARVFWKVFNPSVIVSTNSKKVVTSIPTNIATC